MKAHLEFDLDCGMYRAYVVTPIGLKENLDNYYWGYPETTDGYGDTIDEAVKDLRRQLEIAKSNAEGK